MSDMSGRAAEEIRARLARQNMTKSELARRLNVSHTWVTNRLTGNQEIGLNELQLIADALGVSVVSLLPVGGDVPVSAIRTGAYVASRPPTRRDTVKRPPNATGPRRPNLRRHPIGAAA